MEYEKTINDCINLVSKKIEEIEFYITEYPQFQQYIHNSYYETVEVLPNEEESLQEQLTLDISKKVENWKTELDEWMNHLDNLKKLIN
jgi:hypothetical protein